MTMSDRPKAIEEALKDWQPDIRSDIHLTPLENLQTALQEIFRLQARVAELEAKNAKLREDIRHWLVLTKPLLDPTGKVYAWHLGNLIDYYREQADALGEGGT